MRHPCLCLVATPFRPSGLVGGNLLKSCCLPYPQPTRISITPLVRRHSWRGFCSRTPRISVLDPSSRVFERKSVLRLVALRTESSPALAGRRRPALDGESSPAGRRRLSLVAFRAAAAGTPRRVVARRAAAAGPRRPPPFSRPTRLGRPPIS